MNLENMPRRTRMIAAGSAAALLAAWLVFSPYHAAQQWSQAMQAKDMATAQAWMDSEAIRANLELLMQAEMEAKAKQGNADPSNPMNALGKLMATAVIQAMSTPQGLLGMADMTQQMSAMMGDGKQATASEVSTLTGETEYRSPLRFALKVKQGDKPLYNFIFHRRWLTWRLAEVVPAEHDSQSADAGKTAVKPVADTPLKVTGQRADTRFGTLTVQRDPETMISRLYWNEQPLTVDLESLEFVSLDKGYRFSQEDVVVVRGSTGGAAGDSIFLLVSLKGDLPPWVSSPFMGSGNEPVFTQEGDKLNAALGFVDGKEVSAIYSRGELRQVSMTGAGGAAAPEQDCRYLFEDMYLPYVRGNDMQSRCADSGLTEVSGMSTVRAWNDYSGDPRFNLRAMEQLTAETCRSGAEVSWPQFRQQVCGG